MPRALITIILKEKGRKGISYGHINVGDFLFFCERCGKLPSWIESTNSSFKNKSKRVELHIYPLPLNIVLSPILHLKIIYA